MTGTEVITLARLYFGEATALTVPSARELDLFNTALKELYRDLPVDKLRHLITTDTVTLTNGRGNLPDTWDTVVSVYLDGISAVQVTTDVIRGTEIGSYWLPLVPVFAVDNNYLWVVPNGTVTVSHVDPPAEVTSLAGEITAFPEQYHTLLASLLASYMYAQEEDAQQAAYYRGEYVEQLTSLSAPAEAQA